MPGSFQGWPPTTEDGVSANSEEVLFQLGLTAQFLHTSVATVMRVAAPVGSELTWRNWAGLGWKQKRLGHPQDSEGMKVPPGPPSSPAASPPPLPPPPRSSSSPISLVHWPVGATYTTVAAVVIVLQRRLPRHSLDHHSKLDQVPASQGCYRRGGRDHKVL